MVLGWDVHAGSWKFDCACCENGSTFYKHACAIGQLMGLGKWLQNPSVHLWSKTDVILQHDNVSLRESDIHSEARVRGSEPFPIFS